MYAGRPESVREGWVRLTMTILASPVPEDPLHAASTLKWLIRLWPQAPLELRMAAYGHDIERALAPRRVRRKWFSDYDAYKQAHALASAEIFRQLLVEAGIDPEFARVAARAVAHHESGGYPAADILAWADKLSFFETNLALFARRANSEELRERILWGMRKLPPRLRGLARALVEGHSGLAFSRDCG